jgi:hypothetical protein
MRAMLATDFIAERRRSSRVSNDFGLSLDREPPNARTAPADTAGLSSGGGGRRLRSDLPVRNIARTYNVSDTTILCLVV